MSAPTIAIDFDGTWTADPTVFGAFAWQLRSRGWRVIVVTQRATGLAEVESAVRAFVDRVIACPGEAKRDACTALGEAVTVWIDDKPETVGEPR